MSIEKLKLEIQLALTQKVLGPLKAITSGTGEMAKVMTAAKGALRDLNQEQSKITNYNTTLESTRKASAAYKEQKAALGELNVKLAAAKEAQAAMVGSVKQARAEHAALMRSFAKDDSTPGLAAKLYNVRDNLAKLETNYTKAQNATRRFAYEIKDATKDVEAAKKSKDSYSEALKRVVGELNAAGMPTKQLGAHQDALKTKIDAATAAIDKQGKKMERMHAARANYEKTMAFKDKLAGGGGKALVAGAAINAAASIPVIAYAKAEDSATQLKIAMLKKGGILSADFEQINALAEKLGNRLPGTTSDFQDMMTMLIRQGMPAKALLGGLGEATAYLAVQLKMAPAAAAEFASKLQDATRTTDRDMMGLMDTIQKTYYLGVDQGNMLQGFAKLSPALSILRMEGLAAAKALAPLLVMADQSGMAGESAGNAFRKIFQMSLDAKKLAKGNAILSGTGIKLDFSDGKGESGGIDKIYSELAKLKSLDTQRRLAALKKIFGDDAETLLALTIMIEKGADEYRKVQAKMEAQADIQERVNLQLKTLKNLWDAASGTFTNALVALGESIAPELHATAEWLGKLAERTHAWMKEHPGMAAGLMHLVKWGGLAALVVGGILIAVSAVIAPIAMFTYGLGALSAIAPVLAASLGSVMLALVALPAAAAAGYAVGTLINAAWNWAISAVLGYETTLGGAIFDLVEWIKTKFSEVVTWIGALPGRFMAAGAAIIDGIMGGISSKWEDLKTLMRNVADSLSGLFGKRIDAHSPSRVFATLGGYTMEGLEEGILGGQGGPLAAIIDTAKRLTAAGAGILIGGAAMAGDLPRIDTRPAMAASGMPAAGGGNTYIFQISPSPGMDEQALARMIAAEVQRIDLQRAARSRSRLVDEA